MAFTAISVSLFKPFLPQTCIFLIMGKFKQIFKTTKLPWLPQFAGGINFATKMLPLLNLKKLLITVTSLHENWTMIYAMIIVQQSQHNRVLWVNNKDKIQRKHMAQPMESPLFPDCFVYCYLDYIQLWFLQNWLIVWCIMVMIQQRVRERGD